VGRGCLREWGAALLEHNRVGRRAVGSARGVLSTLNPPPSCDYSCALQHDNAAVRTKAVTLLGSLALLRGSTVAHAVQAAVRGAPAALQRPLP